MANLTEQNQFDASVYRFDQADPVQGWDGSNLGISNLQAQALANRTQWLKARVDLGPRITGYDLFTPASAGDQLTLVPTQVQGKHLRVNVSSFNAVVNLPNATAVSDNGNMSISVEPGVSASFLSSNNRYVEVRPAVGDKIYTADTNQEVDQVFLNPYTVAHFHKLTADRWIYWKTMAVEHCIPGSVMAWAANSVPYGWLECNGASLSRSVYAALFANIGTTFGSSGAGVFNIPDLRGEFIRGWDNGRGIDTDSFVLQATTTNGSPNITNADTTGLSVGMAISGTGIPVGATITSITNSSTFVISANATASANFVSLTVSRTRSFGSAQSDMFKLHNHRISRLSNVVNSTSPTTAAVTDWESASGVQSTDNVQPVGGAETRPRNVALMYIIKF